MNIAGDSYIENILAINYKIVLYIRELHSSSVYKTITFRITRQKCVEEILRKVFNFKHKNSKVTDKSIKSYPQSILAPLQLNCAVIIKYLDQSISN